MPLVTVTCSKPYYPNETTERTASPSQIATFDLVTNLPRLIVEQSYALGLEAGTPAEAVQVDVKQFHPLSVNSVDIWMHVQFSESFPDNTNARDALISVLTTWFQEQETELNWALDMFWGPGQGMYLFTNGDTMTW